MISSTAKLDVASLAVKVRARLVSADVAPSLTSTAVIVIVGAVASTAEIAVAELVLPAASVALTEPVWPSDSGLVMLQLPLPSAVVVASTVVPSDA